MVASANGNGAGIGSASGATGGYPNNTTSVGAVIEINGGTVTGNGGDVERIYLGSSSGNGAGIGGGQGACANITITDGHVTANSAHGAGIGNGAGGGTAARGSVVITGGTIRGYSLDGANIGAGFGGHPPTYKIHKEADILMQSRWFDPNDPGSISCSGNNLASDNDKGYFASVLALLQAVQPSTLDALTGGSDRTLNQYNNFSQSFACTDREMQARISQATETDVTRIARLISMAA